MSAIEESGSIEVFSEDFEIEPNDKESSGVAQKVETFTTSLFDFFGNIIDWVYPVNPVTHSREFWYIPKFVENVLGKVMYPVMCISQGGTIQHLYSQKIDEIARNLAQHSKRDLDYEVTVINNNVVNAWCLPGGKIAVYQLLLEKIDFYVHNKDLLGLHGYTDPETGKVISYQNITVDDVIAALLGHEMTHADARHAARKLELSFVVQALVFGVDCYFTQKLESWEQDLKIRSQISNELPERIRKEKQNLEFMKTVHDFAFNWITKLAMNLYFLFGSRTHELEADKYGSMLAVEAGYNPAGALFLQKILKNESKSIYDFLPKIFHDIHGLFSSHPHCDVRQQELYPIVRDWQILQS